MALKNVVIKSPLGTGVTSPVLVEKVYLSAASTTTNDLTKITYLRLNMTPAIGNFYKVGGTSPIVMWSQDDVNKGLIEYRPDPNNKTVLAVDVTFRISDTSDPTSAPSDGKLKIQYNIPDGPPSGTLSPASVSWGKTVIIGASNISFTDVMDPPSAIFFRLESYPQYGKLLRNGVELAPGSEFSQDDVNKGRVVYAHTYGFEEPEDEIVFKARDTKNKWTGIEPGTTVTQDDANVFRLKIIINPIGNLVPVNKGPKKVNKCEKVSLQTTDLEYTWDDPQAPILPFTFTITKMPQHGIFTKNGNPLGIGATFTNADIAAGIIEYEQDCSDTNVDPFEFTVTRGSISLTKQTFDFELIPNLTPLIAIVPLVVKQCDTGVISDLNISINDPEGKLPEELEIELTVLPKHGTLLFNGSPMSVGQKFTYADIISGSLSYKHGCTVHDPLTDSIGFLLYDGYVQEPFELPIVIQAKIDKPPYMTYNYIQDCDQPGEISFGPDKFDFTDDDTSFDLVFLKIMSLPKKGTFYIDGIPVVEGDMFDKASWDTHTFRYVANAPDGSLPTPEEILNGNWDSMDIELSDELNVVDDLKWLVKLPDAPNVCPEIINNGINVIYETSKVISEVQLFASNKGLDPNSMIWTLDTLPLFGSLKLNDQVLAIGDTWTSQDILDMKLSYTHTSQFPVEDRFEFSVFNGFCSLSDEFVIKFVKGLMVFTDTLMVDQGVNTIIPNTHLLSSSGSVNTNNDLVFTITQLPTLGDLFFNGVKIVVGDKFTQTDIDNNMLSYTAEPTQRTDTSDFFKFSLTDGIQNLDDVFRIIIKLTDTPPTVIVNGISVGELKCAGIAVNNISINDDTSEPNELNIEILLKPIYGKIYIGATELNDGDIFNYQNIIDGKLMYCSDTAGATLDSFDFSVTDLGGNVVDEFDNGDPLRFPIVIIPPPPPALRNNGVASKHCVETLISSARLAVLHINTSEAINYEFTVKVVPIFGAITLDNNLLSVGDTFTYADILASKLEYFTSRLEDTTDSFTFDVNGPALSLTDQVFTITLIKEDFPPWVCVNDGLTMFEHETKVITLETLQMCDINLDDDIKSNIANISLELWGEYYNGPPDFSLYMGSNPAVPILSGTVSNLTQSGQTGSQVFNVSVPGEDFALPLSVSFNNDAVSNGKSNGLTTKFFSLNQSQQYNSFSQINFGATPTFTSVISILEFNAGTGPIHPSLPSDKFALEANGFLNIITAGTYKFRYASDDGLRVWVNNNQIINNDGLNQMTNVKEYQMFLTVGPHPIKVQFFENEGGAAMMLRYSGPDTNNEFASITGNAISFNDPSLLPGDRNLVVKKLSVNGKPAKSYVLNGTTYSEGSMILYSQSQINNYPSGFGLINGDWSDVLSTDPATPNAFPTGLIFTDTSALANGTAMIQVPVEYPGGNYQAWLNVSSGSAKLTIRDINGKSIVLSQCMTFDKGGTSVIDFTVPANSNEILIQVQEGCTSAPGTAVWSVELYKV